MLIWQILKSDLHIVLIFQSEFKHVKLKHADHADYDFFHAALVLLEHLDSTLLRYLCDTLYKLLSLHGIHKRYPRKMLRCKCRDSLKLKFILCCCECISDGVYSRIKHTYDVSRICLVHYFSLIRHHLLWL